ncbi:MAG: prolipoprotein diacylglyceryl transferase [Myxococcales bacterium]|nr:prolipoprotein diacylglyceryl transferase [Myxococcales bacterium]
MRPVLLDFHGYGLHSYGIAIAVAFLVAIFVGTRTAERTGENPDKVRDLCFWLLVSSLVGARVLFILTNIPDYARLCHEEHDCWRAFKVWEGGLVFYGGFFGALAMGVWYMRRHQMPFWRTADILAPSVALGHFFGRLGCFAAGCCWGAESNLPWAVRFPSESLVFEDYVARGVLPATAQVTPALHPVQLYEAFGDLGLFFALSILGRRKRWDGQVLVAYLLGYAALRFTVELFRGDAVRKFVVASLSTSQAIAIAAALLAVALWWWRARRSRFSRA